MEVQLIKSYFRIHNRLHGYSQEHKMHTHATRSNDNIRTRSRICNRKRVECIQLGNVQKYNVVMCEVEVHVHLLLMLGV